MGRRRETKALPAGVEELRGRVERWRRTRKKRSPMPEELWEDAARLARVHGVSPIARWLGLSYYTLQGRMERVDEAAEAGAFVVSRFGWQEPLVVRQNGATRRAWKIGSGRLEKRDWRRWKNEPLVRVGGATPVSRRGEGCGQVALWEGPALHLPGSFPRRVSCPRPFPRRTVQGARGEGMEVHESPGSEEQMWGCEGSAIKHEGPYEVFRPRGGLR